MKTATNRTLLAQYKRAVRAVEPSAYLHSWRILGYSGSVVYGIYSDRLEWLSENEPSGLDAWRAAAAQSQVDAMSTKPRFSAIANR